MPGPELLVSNPSFAWGAVIIALFFLVVLILMLRMMLGLVESRKIVGGSRLDWILSLGWFFAILLGLAGWALHPFFPTHPWRFLVIRDFAFRFGLWWGVAIVFPLVPIALLLHPERRQRFLASARHMRRGIGLLLFMVVPVWLGWGGTKDVKDFFSSPVTVVDTPVRYVQAYRSFPAEIFFRDSGRLIIPHGMSLLLRQGGEYQIQYAGDSRLLLSCRELPPR